MSLPAAPLADGEHIELVGHLGGVANKVVVLGDYAYVGYGSEFAILDVSNPASIHRVGWLVAAGEVVDIAIMGNIAYITYQAGDYRSYIGRTGLEVIDIQDPAAPISIAVQEFTGCGANPQIIIASPYAYLAYTACSVFGGIIQNNGAYLYKLDISDPAHPSIITSTLYFMSDFTAIATLNNVLYAVWKDVSGTYLKAFDVSDPTGLVEISMTQVTSDSTAIALSGDYAFLAAAEDGMQVVEISDPFNPSPVVTHTLPGSAQDIFIAEEFAYLAAGEAGLQILDITDPLNPFDVDTYATSDPPRDIFVAGDHAYLANGWGGFEIVQLTDLTQAGLDELPEKINDLAIRELYRYIAAEDGFWVLDLNDPGLPLAIAHNVTESPCSSLVLKDNYAYVACPQIGLRILDITDPQAPSEAGIFDLPGDTQEMAVVDHTLFVAQSGLLILDTSNPLSPAEVSTFYVEDHAVNAVAVAGEYAYLGMENGDLVILDISDLSAPVQVGGYDPADRYGSGQQATAIQVQGTIAYLTTVVPPPTPLAGYYIGDTWLIDVSEPENPSLISSISNSGAPYDITVIDGAAAIAYEREGLCLYDISDPTAPLERGSYNPSEDIYGVMISGDLIYFYNNSLFITEYVSGITQIFLPAIPQFVSDGTSINQETFR